MQYSYKREKTQGLILNAFSELYMKSDIDRISVKMICEKAEINRSTFYTYFNDVYQLQEALEENLVVEITGLLIDDTELLRTMQMDKLINLVVDFIRRKNGLPIMVISRNAQRISMRVTEILFARLQKMGQMIPEDKRWEIRLAVSYHLAGAAAITSMIQGNSVVADAECAIEYIGKFADEGPLSVLRGSIK